MPDKTWTCPACNRTHPISVGQCHHRDDNAAKAGVSAEKPQEAKTSPVVPNAEPEKKPAKKKAAKKAAKGASDASGD